MNENKNPAQPETVAARKASRLPLIALATLPLTVGLVLAQQGANTASSATTPDVTAQAQRVQPVQPGQRPGQSGTPQPGTQTQPGQMPQRQMSGTNYGDVFLQKLAAQLGITTGKLKAAAVAAGSATIDQGVKAGDFPTDRAAMMKQGLQQNPFAIGGGRGGRGRHGPGTGGHGPDGDGPDHQGGPGGQTTPTTPSSASSGTSGT